MIIVLKQNPEKEKVDSFINMLHEKGFSTNVSKGESHTIVGLIGDTAHLPIDLISSMEIVELSLINI
ncbi:MAG: 3-deoxy-7-phosphoheptulonate synthase, partial [Oscillospiraceae bacterium]|nr:3-deoxy-7-phosphoheptulonate synthase [Oscillospiraceae bacterium]